MRKEQRLPEVTFKTRVRDESIGGDNPYRWEDKTTEDYFAGKRILLIGLPGAFTPTCSTRQLPAFEENYVEILKMGIDDIYCVSVNDAFVMNAWGKQLGIEKVKLIPDGSGLFTRGLGMMVKKDNLGFGERSWRYVAIVNDQKIEYPFAEISQRDDAEDDPFEISTLENVTHYLINRANENGIR